MQARRTLFKLLPQLLLLVGGRRDAEDALRGETCPHSAPRARAQNSAGAAQRQQVTVVRQVLNALVEHPGDEAAVGAALNGNLQRAAEHRAQLVAAAAGAAEQATAIASAVVAGSSRLRTEEQRVAVRA